MAVVPAVLYHAGVEGFDGGIAGLDVFFVISGYLITRIIITELGEGRFTLAQFFERRARRVLPALFVVMAACLPFVWFWLPAAEIHRFGLSLASVSLFVSNMYFWLSNTGYFALRAELHPLIHLWSLSAEEQYYIIYPIFLTLAWSLGTKRILILLALVFLTSIALAVWGTQSHAAFVINGAYYLLPTRGWAIMVGAFVAFFLHHRTHSKSQAVNQFLSFLGLAMILYSFAYFDRQTPIPSLYTLIPTFGAALIILTAVPTTIVYRLLSVRFLVGIGLVSYSAYLLHQPMLAFTRFRILGEPAYSVILPICFFAFVLAWVSWKYVETPFRNPRNFTRKGIFLMSGAAILIFSGIGFTLALNKGFPEYNDNVITERLSEIGIKKYELDFETLQAESWSVLKEIHNKDYDVVDNPTDRRNNFDLTSNKMRILIVGNSHSKDMFNLFYYSDELSRQFDVARYGIQLQNIDDNFFTSDAYQYAQVIMISTWYWFGDLDRLHELASRILNDNKKLVIVEPIVQFDNSGTYTAADFTISKELEKAQQTGQRIRADDVKRKVNSVYTSQYLQYTSGQMYLEQKQQFDRIKASIISDYPEVVFVNRLDYICPDNLCHGLTPAGRKTHYDHTHQTIAGTIFFGKQLPKTMFYTDLIEGVGLASKDNSHP